jgi:hypothetical protein
MKASGHLLPLAFIQTNGAQPVWALDPGRTTPTILVCSQRRPATLSVPAVFPSPKTTSKWMVGNTEIGEKRACRRLLPASRQVFTNALASLGRKTDPETCCRFPTQVVNDKGRYHSLKSVGERKKPQQPIARLHHDLATIRARTLQASPKRTSGPIAMGSSAGLPIVRDLILNTADP